MKFSAEELHNEALREIAWRKLVYPRRVSEGKMTQQTADRKIAMMQDIAEHFGAMAKQEQLL